MSDIKLSPEELALFSEVGSRGDYFREATRDRAVQQVNETGRTSEITSDGGSMVDVVLAPAPTSSGESVTEVVPPSDFAAIAGKAPDDVADPPKHWPNNDGSGA